MTTPGCPFCDFTQPEVTVLADGHVQAFISLSPINRYHVLVVPKAHYERLADVPHEILMSVMRVVQRVSVAVRTVARPDAVSHLSDDDLTGSGFNLVSHWKMHVIPRYRNDAVVIDWHREPDPGSEVRARYCHEVRQALLGAQAAGHRRMFPDTVETLRLHLRRPVPTDAERIFQAYAQDREVTRYLEWVPHIAVEITKKFIAFCQDRWTDSVAFPYVITRKEDGELLGMIEVRPNRHRANFGYVLARAHWGHGFMPEAIAALVKITLGHPTIYRMEATCDVENRASSRALEKSGFSREGLLRRYIVHPNISPEPRDSLLYALTK